MGGILVPTNRPVSIQNDGGGVQLSSVTSSVTVTKAEKMTGGTISVNGADVEICAGWDFSVEKDLTAEVLVTMDVGTGLFEEAIRIYHSDNGENGWELYNDKVYNITYDSKSGKVSFITTSFSSYAIATAPEPSAFGLLAGLSALALVAARRKRK